MSVKGCAVKLNSILMQNIWRNVFFFFFLNTREIQHGQAACQPFQQDRGLHGEIMLNGNNKMQLTI